MEKKPKTSLESRILTRFVITFVIATSVLSNDCFLHTNWSDFKQRSLLFWFFLLLHIGWNCQKPINYNQQSEMITVSCIQFNPFLLDKGQCWTWWPVPTKVNILLIKELVPHIYFHLCIYKQGLKIKVFTNNNNKGQLVKPYSTTWLCLCNSMSKQQRLIETVLFARNICRLCQLIFDSDHNFHDHGSTCKYTLNCKNEFMLLSRV